jgi:hypothetical protein
VTVPSQFFRTSSSVRPFCVPRVQRSFKVPRVFYLLAFAYVVSLEEGKNPAEFEFEKDDIMIDHFNKCMKGRFFDEFPHSKRFSLKIVKYLEHRFKD